VKGMNAREKYRHPSALIAGRFICSKGFFGS